VWGKNRKGRRMIIMGNKFTYKEYWLKIISIVVMSLIAIGSYKLTYNLIVSVKESHKQAVEQEAIHVFHVEAVERGYGAWIVDREGNTTFEWVEPEPDWNPPYTERRINVGEPNEAWILEYNEE
jgi:hypothetical protein